MLKGEWEGPIANMECPMLKGERERTPNAER